MLGVGAQSVLLCAHLVAVHRGESESLDDTQVRAARAAQSAGLALMVCSGLVAVALHVMSNTVPVLFEPAFLFKWVLIVAATVLLFLQHARIGSHTLLGLAGGVWFALFLVHTLAPIITWASLLVIFTAWLAGFALVWAIAVFALSGKTARPSKVLYTAAPVIAAAPLPKPLPTIVAPKPAPVAMPRPAPMVVPKPVLVVPKPITVAAALGAHKEPLLLPESTWWHRLLEVLERLMLSAATHPQEQKIKIEQQAEQKAKPPAPAPVPVSKPVVIAKPTPPPAPLVVKPTPPPVPVVAPTPRPLDLSKLPEVLEHDEPLVPAQTTPAPTPNPVEPAKPAAAPAPEQTKPVVEVAVPGLHIMPRTPADIANQHRPPVAVPQP